MMSIERELLMRWWRGATDQADLNELYDTTVKLLTQPEQEPICKGIEKNKFNEGLKVGQEAGYRAILEAAKAKQFYLDENERLSNLLLSAEDKIQELLAQPEQDLEVLKKDWVNFGYEAGRKSALSKQEPLTPRQGLEEYKRGYAQAELDLKREPLSDEEIVKLWVSKSPANEFECVRLVEKAHGIGVEL